MMEEQLRELVEYAEPKPKSFICVSGNKSRMKTSFILPLEFPPSSVCMYVFNFLNSVKLQSQAPKAIHTEKTI